MASLAVEFRYEPGLSFEPFADATLLGSWDARGQTSAKEWSSQPMTPMTTRDGSPAFATTVHFDAAAAGTVFSWGVRVQRGDRSAAWGVFAEVPDENSRDQHLTFRLEPASATLQQETYRLSWHRARGAHRSKGPAGGGPDGIGFRAWAPNARAVEVVFGGATGYLRCRQCASPGWRLRLP